MITGDMWMNDKSTFKRLSSQSTKESRKYSLEDLMRLRERGEREATKAFVVQKQLHRSESITGRSGVLPIHKGCTVSNYVIEHGKPQKHALDYTKWFIDNFHLNNGGGFIFSGDTGTGKNHLSAAICNALMAQGKECLIITVSDLMMRLNSCYTDRARIREQQFFDGMVKFDLVIIDEIGLGRTRTDAANNERLALNQIIDKRLGNLKPTGILTNLDREDIKKVLGVRIMDRMRNNNGQWVSFEWPSFRK